MDIHRAHGPGMSGYRPPYRGTGNVSPVWQRANVGRFRREVRRRVCRRRRRCVQQHCGLRVDDPIRGHRRPCLAQVLPSSERLPRSRHRTRRPAHACRGRGAQLQTPRSRSRRGNAQAFDAKSGYAHAVTRLRSLGSSRDVATSEGARLSRSSAAAGSIPRGPALALGASLEGECALCSQAFGWSDDELRALARKSIDASSANAGVKAELIQALSRW